MASKNPITGDEIKTKGVTTDAYRDSWERIFGTRPDSEKTEVSLISLPKTDIHNIDEK